MLALTEIGLLTKIPMLNPLKLYIKPTQLLRAHTDRVQKCSYALSSAVQGKNGRFSVYHNSPSLSFLMTVHTKALACICHDCTQLYGLLLPVYIKKMKITKMTPTLPFLVTSYCGFQLSPRKSMGNFHLQLVDSNIPCVFVESLQLSRCCIHWCHSILQTLPLDLGVTISPQT